MRTPAPLLLLLLALTACSGSDAAAPVRAAPPASPAALAAPAKVASDTLWLCRPGLADNPCEGGLDALVQDGTPATELFAPATDPPVDCFYVYPTVSKVEAMNAPMEVDDSLVSVVRAQAARFADVCRVFAPVYRQITLSAIFTGHYENAGARATAERDIDKAWQDYLANHNDGRGVVLIGHSQGARTLTALVAKRIDGDAAAREKLVSALLLGGDVTVAEGQDVGGSFRNVAACRTPGQTGCVVAYSAYGAVPPPDAIFGTTDEPGREVLCVDPSLLAGEAGSLDPYLPTSDLVSRGGAGFTAYPGQLRAQCRSEGGVSFLQVEQAEGSLVPTPPQALGPRWGLHNGDVNLALGDLVDVVRAQAEAYAAG